MVRKITSLSRKTLFTILVLLIVIGIGVYVRDNNKTAKAEYPQYYNFSGNYVFSIPKTYNIDEQSVPGAQLVYSGQITVKTLEDVYGAGGISVYGISDLTDHSSKAFKDYVNNAFVPDLKKNLSTNDVQTKFGKANDADNASVTVSKDRKMLRFIYLKGGQHPAAVVANAETSPVKKIDETITDLEISRLNKEVEPIKKAIQNVAQLVKDQKAVELYNSSAPELKAKNTQDELTKALQAAAPYTAGNITISGVSYTPTGFSAVMRFTKLTQDDQQPAVGSLTFKKIDGQWKLQALSLPTPKQ